MNWRLLSVPIQSAYIKDGVRRRVWLDAFSHDGLARVAYMVNGVRPGAIVVVQANYGTTHPNVSGQVADQVQITDDSASAPGIVRENDA